MADLAVTVRVRVHRELVVRESDGRTLILTEAHARIAGGEEWLAAAAVHEEEADGGE